MPEHDYTNTSLWRHTLVARPGPDPHAQQRERLRASYVELRKKAATLLEENARSMPDFTVHDISHVDALWETADLVCGTEVTLNPAEAYVLGCAFVLHDAAMGSAAYGTSVPEALGEKRWRDLVAMTYYDREGCWPDREELDAPPPEIAKACQAAAIRATHADQARRLVDQPWRSNTGNDIFLIEEVQLREVYGPLIGELAASHWWPVDRLADEFRHQSGSLPWQPSNWTIEPLKLACVLRLADATQIDSRRAPTFLSSLRKPRGVSREHWRFQEHISRPYLKGDRVTYNSLRPFPPQDATAWWLALDYLRGIDQELKAVDALLHDLGRTRLAARAVAGVDSPERFAELFRVQDWRPIDATVKVSDVPALVRNLGGEQLYGDAPEVAVRELIQNAQDAVLARRALQPGFPDGRVEVRLAETDGSWCLEVSDNGVGMDEEILLHGLLDFGSSGWSSARVRNRLPGLASGGFQPSGRFGIGFFSVFLLGDRVELITRRYDGSLADARRIAFDGPASRPLLTPLSTQDWVPEGTTVRVMLKTSPYDAQGLFQRSDDERLTQLVQRLVLENAVPVHAWEPGATGPEVIPPFSLAMGSPDEVFDRLYPPQTDSWRSAEEKLRLRMRDDFAERATEVLDEKGRRIGLATLWNSMHFQGRRNFLGTVTVNGFLADTSVSFAGYLAGQPSRASRDRADLVATQEQVRHWMRAQEQRLRSTGHFEDPLQLELAHTLHCAFDLLPDNVAFALTAQGVLRPADVAEWAAQRNEVFLTFGWPITWRTRPPEVYHYLSGQPVPLPDNWIFIVQIVSTSPLGQVFPANRDTAYDSARDHPTLTWQKQWWRLSGGLHGLFLRELCQVWSCTIESLLAPVAQRNWSDTLHLDDESLGPVSGYLLQRPSSAADKNS
ncbi:MULTISPECIES: ATP-binding protein [unclassified Streptomyces]|uniref:HD domain-containing protein n=1 Tax=unclassified Streptomyces TaxID=2593676 RepID=UPI002366720A|nr:MULTISPECIES: ATP-binding protein [unclassified Streptomyces]MDF3142526.1 ATP-binding protein [Streptomyces sp. T21Q-yed]WDF39730.1 ATP-binding protein [Streptomyces sp. T12]